MYFQNLSFSSHTYTPFCLFLQDISIHANDIGIWPTQSKSFVLFNNTVGSGGNPSVETDFQEVSHLQIIKIKILKNNDKILESFICNC